MTADLERSNAVFLSFALLSCLRHSFLLFLIRWKWDWWMQQNGAGKAVDDDDQNSMLAMIISGCDYGRRRKYAIIKGKSY